MSGDFIGFTKSDIPFSYDQFCGVIVPYFINTIISRCTFVGGELFDKDIEHQGIVEP